MRNDFATKIGARPAAFALYAGMLLVAPTADAQTLIATRPGLMCAKPEALALLTLPDGSSRTARFHPRPADVAVKLDGGCIDIPVSARVETQSRRRNTSIVTFADNGSVRTFVVPNIDFAEAAQAPQRSASGPSPISNEDPAPDQMVAEPPVQTPTAQADLPQSAPAQRQPTQAASTPAGPELAGSTPSQAAQPEPAQTDAAQSATAPADSNDVAADQEKARLLAMSEDPLKMPPSPPPPQDNQVQVPQEVPPPREALIPTASDPMSVIRHGPGDIDGLRLGMSLEEAQARLGDAYNYSARDPIDGRRYAVQANDAIRMVVAERKMPDLPNAPGTPDQEDVVLMSLHDRIYFIEHAGGYANGDMPDQAAFQAALVHKFGRPSFAGISDDQADQTIFWYYSADDPVLDAQGRCRLAYGLRVENDLPLAIPAGYKRGMCSTFQEATLIPAQDGRHLSKYVLVLLDQTPVVRMLAQLKAAGQTRDAAQLGARATTAMRLAARSQDNF